MHSSQVPIQPGLSVKCFLASFDRTLEALWLTVDGLNVHEEVVANTEASTTLLALWTEGGREGGERGGWRERGVCRRRKGGRERW